MTRATGISPGVRPNRRPRSLVEAAQSGRAAGDIDASLREFLDEFYCEASVDKRAMMLAAEPPLTTSDRENAYLAAMAEHLALRHGLPIPAWVNAETRFLKRPFFPSGLESLKATLWSRARQPFAGV